MLFLFSLSSHKSFDKNDGDWQLKYSVNICSFIPFSSFLTSFINSPCNFNGDILRLVFTFAAFVVSGIGSGARWNSDSNVGIFSKFFILNNLLLKLLRILLH